MKKIILIIIAFAIAFPSMAQQTDTIYRLTKEDYLRKSKSQKTTGLILLGIGGLITGTGLLTSSGEAVVNGFLPSEDRSNSGAGIAIAGVIMMGSSIPFFSASSSSKKKALSFSLKTEKALLPAKNEFAFISIPSLNLTIRL